MTERRRARLVAALAATGILSAFAAGAEERYLRRLSLPVAADDISSPTCVTADPHTGEAFVCDPRTNRILIFDRDGFFDYQVLTGAEVGSPVDIAVDPDGVLVVLAQRGQGELPVEIDFDGQHRRDVPLVGLPRDAAPPALGSLALSLDGKRLYAVDGANLMLWIADRDGLVLSGVDLAPGVEDEEERPNYGPGNVDVYGERVVVPQPMLGRVLVFDLDGRKIGQVGQRGSAPGQLGYPTAAAVDRDGDVIVLDGQRMIVARWRITGNRLLSEHLGLGDLPGFLYFPYDLALDPEGLLYVAQPADGRVQVYEGFGAAPPPPVR